MCVLAAGKEIQSSAQASDLLWGCGLSILNCKVATQQDGFRKGFGVF